MKALIAIDSFKGCMTTNEASGAIERGIRAVYQNAEIMKVPIADGGEGTVDSLVHGLNGNFIEKTVHDPLMRPIKAKYGILPDKTAVIEMASCSGLPLLKEDERNPMKTTTYGVGELIHDAINQGCRQFIIGIGGSATNDAGIGMLESLGFKFYDQNHHQLPPIGASLEMIQYIDDEEKIQELKDCRFQILCDVNNPFSGPNGASFVYASQKGATDEIVRRLDHGLKHLAELIKKDFNKDVEKIKGAGAAGGLGGGFHAFLDAELKSGIKIIFEQLKIEEKIKDCDFLITGEGKMDFQSAMGKAPYGISQLGKKYNIPVIGLAGAIDDDAYNMHDYGLTALFSILNYPMSLKEAMDKIRANHLLEQNTRELFRLIKQIKKTSL